MKEKVLFLLCIFLIQISSLNASETIEERSDLASECSPSILENLAEARSDTEVAFKIIAELRDIEKQRRNLFDDFNPTLLHNLDKDFLAKIYIFAKKLEIYNLDDLVFGHEREREIAIAIYNEIQLKVNGQDERDFPAGISDKEINGPWYVVLKEESDRRREDLDQFMKKYGL